MNSKLRYIFLFLAFLFVSSRNFAGIQINHQSFDHLTVNDGLSSNRIWRIFRDSKDFLWISTDLGLDRYDSYEFIHYRFDEKKAGTISSDNVLCIFEDLDKNLWFGTSDGLNLYDPITDSFKIFKHNQEDKNSINGNKVNSIIQDKSGTIWFITDGDCINKWVPQTQTFVRYPFGIKKKGLFPRPTDMIASDSKGNLWVVSLDRGIFRFDPQSGTFTKFEDPSADLGVHCYKSIYIDSQDKIWITSDDNGFFSYDQATNHFEKFGSNGDGKGTNKIKIISLIPEGDNRFLLAVDQGGINVFNKTTKTFEYITYDLTNEDGLNNNGIWCFHRDREGILWIGTSGGGINYINPNKSRFKLYRHNGNPNSLSYSFTGCFFEDHEGMIWIGTDGGGVNVFDPHTEKFLVYKNNPKDPFSISGNVIRSISEDKDNNIWIGTWGMGLNRFDRKTRKFYHYLQDPQNPSSISGNSIWNLTFDKNDLLWLGIQGNGINLFDKKKQVIERFVSSNSDSNSISDNKIWLIYPDDENNVWVCTQNGLSLYNPENKSFKVYNFPDNNIHAVWRDKSANLWVGSNTKGAYYCKPDGTIIKTYNTSSGLPNNRIQAIVGDNHENIWFSTGFGISQFNHETGKFRNYTKDDGLQGDEFYLQTSLKTRKGEIYFGGFNGFNVFFPDSLKDNDFIPPVYLTDFQIFNKPVTYGLHESNFQTNITVAKEITLEPDQSVFSFSFAAINYTNPAKNHYAYMMVGFDKDWNYTNASRRYVTYTNLNPGHYTFRVKASNNDDLWNDQGVSLEITILPPWYKTILFKSIALICLCFGIYSIYYIRLKLYRDKEKELSVLVEKRTHEITLANKQLIQNQYLIKSQAHTIQEANDKLIKLNKTKDRIFSIIAHDLRNPFNVVSGFSGLLLEDFRSMSPETIHMYLNLISNSSKNGNILLENLLQWSRSQTGAIAFEPIRLNMLMVAQETINLLEGDAFKKKIKIQVNIDPNLNVEADEKMLQTILRNLLSNAIKFTHETGSIIIYSVTNSNHIEVCVSDSGLGIPKGKLPLLFKIETNTSTKGTSQESGTGLGLILCREFVEKHGGKIWVETIEGNGSNFKFTLPFV
jgi:signal transduction histidine kinase/ligand-binding sensor domain-containing protein